MRLQTIIAAALLPAAAAAHPAQGPELAQDEQAAPGQNLLDPVFVREPDGTVTIRQTLPAFAAGLDVAPGASLSNSQTDPTAPSPLGRRRSPSEQAIDEDLQRAFEEAADMARFGAPD
jgi:hypothetical protein